MPDSAQVPAPIAPKVAWKDTPDEHDYPAAINYLNLLCPDAEAKDLADKLSKAELMTFKAKDILRSTRLPLLPLEDPAVMRDLAKVNLGIDLSPVLLIRGDINKGIPATVADGYHRVCASYHLSENTDIPARIIDLQQ